MNVLQVLPNPNALGGAETMAALERGELRGSGHRVTVLESRFLRTRFGIVATPGASRAAKAVRHLGDLFDMPAPRWVREILARYRPDVIHVHQFQQIGLPTLAALARHVPIVWTLHDYGLLCPRTTLTSISGLPCGEGLVCTARRNYLLRGLRSVGATFIAPSESMRCAHIRRGLSAADIRVLPNATTTPRGSVNSTVSAGVSSTDSMLFGFAGKLSRHKGADLLPSILDALPHDRMVVAGDGPLAPKHPRLTLLGRLSGDDLETRFWPSVDVLLVPSQWPENQPMVIAEALMRGKPVVASDTGGIGEMLSQRDPNEVGPGILLENWSEHELRAMRKTLSECGAAMSRAALCRGVDYSLERHMEGLLSIYADITK